jgi:stage VI sporulation protein D
LSHGNQSYLRFSLEESVWFQKGQEVDELLSISLAPNITIQESDQYITIKGSLELTGEYNHEMSFEDEEELDDYFSHNPRTVQIVELREEEDVYAFIHEFPVEVTIPKNRIHNLDDIDVSVETFDYAFPEKSCLRLSADLIILGLYGEQHQFYEEEDPDFNEEIEEFEVEEDRDFNKEVEEFEKEQVVLLDDKSNGQDRDDPYSNPVFSEIDVYEVHPPYEGVRNEENCDEFSPISKPEVHNEENEIFTPFEAVARKTPKDEQKENDFVAIQSFEEKYPDISLLKDEESSRKEMPKKKEPVLQVPIPKEPIIEQPIAEPTVEPVSEEPILQEEAEEVPPAEVVPEVKITSQPKKDTSPEAEEKIDEEVLEQEKEETESKGSKKKTGKKQKNKQSITLSEFFARKEEEEHTKLKMCIVQNRDTLDTLSERYEVSVSQIQRVNGLELNQDVYEGQVLYIPQAQTQR